MDELFEGLQSNVTPDLNAMLTHPISDEEIKSAAFGVKGSSAPGEYGLTDIFYQKYWHMSVQKSWSKCVDSFAQRYYVRRFFRTAILPEGWNHTQLCLLPKVPTLLR